VHYDAVALVVAVLGLLFIFPFYCLFPFGLAAGVIAIVLSIRYWRTPLSLLPRARWRFVVALLLGLLNLAVVFGGGAVLASFILLEEF
jgi:hypothetical protein